MIFNYNTCPYCGALNSLGSYLCHNCKRPFNISLTTNFVSSGTMKSPTTDFVSSGTIKDPALIPNPLYNNKRITEINQILEVLERYDLLEKGAYFNESKYYGDFVQVNDRLVGWSIRLIKETAIGTKITFENNYTQTIGDLELIVVRFKNA